jgi:hypothetical protein
MRRAPRWDRKALVPAIFRVCVVHTGQSIDIRAIFFSGWHWRNKHQIRYFDIGMGTDRRVGTSATVGHDRVRARHIGRFEPNLNVAIGIGDTAETAECPQWPLVVMVFMLTKIGYDLAEKSDGDTCNGRTILLDVCKQGASV